jgi:predicted phosphate transport protein (TIGR00153 family)
MLRLIPRETKFFELFTNMANNLTEGARLLRSILQDMQDVEARVRQLKDIEHRGDELTHNLLTTLNQTFITPFDREDIHALASSLDDVLDFVDAAGERLVMYKIRGIVPSAAELADVVVRQGEQLCSAVTRLEKGDDALKYCVEINRLENEADTLTRNALAQLFESEKDPIALIKKKELYEALETASDKAEDAANVIESVVVKSA